MVNFGGNGDQMNSLTMNGSKFMSVSFFSAALLIVFMAYTSVQAEEPGVEKLLLTPEQRVKIDQQRIDYLKSLEVGEVDQEEDKKPEIKPVKKASSKPRSYLPRKLAVSAVIEKPNGNRVVRVNNKYHHTSSKKLPVKLDQTTSSKGVVIKDGDKSVVVPVGSTYLSRKGKVVETYKLDKQKAKTKPAKAILDADNSGVKQTLKDVKMVNTPQK